MSLFDRVVRESRPHLVTVIGQAGVGKSRLLRELAAQIAERAGEAGLPGRALPRLRRRASPTGRSARSSAASSRSSTPTTPSWPGRSSCSGVESVVSDARDRRAAGAHRRDDRPPARHRAARPSTRWPPASTTPRTRSRCATACSPRSARWSRRRAGSWPVVIAIEDIHWADEGMLDLIEYLARWVRGPGADRLPGPRRAARPPPGLGRRAAQRDHDRARAAVPGRDPRARHRPAPGRERQRSERPRGARAAGRRALRRQPPVRRGDGQPDPRGGLARTSRRSPRPSTPCSPPASTRCRPPSGACSSTPRSSARPSGRARSPGVEDEEGIDLAGRAGRASRRRTWWCSSAGSRLAGEHEYAFKHVLIRDVAYSTLPKSVRARKHAQVGGVHRGARRRPLRGRRGDGRRPLRARRGARRRRRRRAGRARADQPQGAGGARGRRRRRRLAVLEPGGARPLRDRAVAAPRARPGDPRPRIAEKLGDVALRLGRVDQATEVWEECLDFHRREEDLARVGDLHRKIGAGLWHKGDREGSIEHYQKGIDLLKDGPPCLELVRLYEEAASLYMHTGDNMLAIYASEKALRLAERLGEAAAASRAHGIFGRVFGRIGDSERARQNLERSVELARESDPAEAVRALLTLGYHLEVSEADYEGAGAAYQEALELAEQTGDLPSKVELHAALAQLAAHRGDWDVGRAGGRGVRQPRRARGPDRQALLPVHDARHAPLARGRLRRGGEGAAARRRARRAGGPLRGRLPVPVLARGVAAPARRLRRRRHRARPGARPLRARGPRRPVGRGDLGARRQPGAGRTAGRGPRGRRRGRAPRRPAALPGRQGGQPRGAGRGGGGSRPRRAPR